MTKLELLLWIVSRTKFSARLLIFSFSLRLRVRRR